MQDRNEKCLYSVRMNKSMRKQAKIAEKRERQRKAIELRKAGMTYSQIGETLQCDTSTAHRLVKSALDEAIDDDVDDLKRMHMARYDTMLMVTWPGVQGGDGASIDRALRVMDRQAALHGLNAPKELTINGRQEHVLELGGDLEDYRESLRAYRQQALGDGEHHAPLDGVGGSEGGGIVEAEVVADDHE